MPVITLSSPIGPLGIEIQANKIVRINFLAKTKKTSTDPFFQQIKTHLQSYFSNPKHIFDLDLLAEGTPFQKSVWKKLQKIPCGRTKTYKALAEELNTSPRAVGNACRANPIPLIIPCHRVVSKTGLGGFAGDTTGKLVAIKKWLLEHEANSIK